MQNNSSRKNSDNIYLNKNLPKNDVILKKPDWIKIRVSSRDKFNDTKNIINNLTTVCEEAMCPNIHECWQKKHAAFMILGDICTRSCAFCNVKTGKPGPIDKKEPLKIAEAVYNMQLSHVVITSVDRDDLEDGGANHFAECIIAIHEKNPKTTVEVLTPDFRNKKNALKIVVSAKPDVYNHNIETIPRLYQSIRPSARYFGSLNLLYSVKEINSTIPTKSGIIVGMGETIPEVSQVMDDLRAARVDFITIGQYLQPTKNHWPVYKYITPEEFDSYKTIAISKGFKMVSSSPMTRSSYHADKDFILLKEALKQESHNQ